jgi:putative endopeptidase
MKFLKKVMILSLTMLPTMVGAQDQPTAGINPADLDTSVSPGEDFYQYAGGGWMKANPLKPEYSSYGVFNDLAEKNRKQLRELFDGLAKEQHAKGSVGQKVTDLYNLAMDSVRLNKEGATPLKKDLAMVATIKKSNLTGALAKIHTTAGNPFFGFGVSADLKNSDLNVVYVSAGTSGLPDRDYYLKNDADSKKIQLAYRDFLTKIFILSGYTKKDAEAATATIYNMEYQFAKVSMSRADARDYSKLYNVRTIEQMQKDYPAINWRIYFDLVGLKDVKSVILTEPAVMAKANEFMTNLTDKQIRDYLSGSYITSSAGYLSDKFGETSFDFYGRILSGQKERKPRWKRALSFPNSMMGEAVGELYVSKYFAQGAKEKILKLIGNLHVSLAEHIAELSWMSDSTKINALVKLNALKLKVGYPDKWRDYSALEIDPAKSLYDNVRAVTIFESKRNISQYGKPVDKSEWGMTPQTINAYYNPSTNEICFPAAILQAPFFDVNADDATNYGAIGVVIGHEMTHGFDDQGRNFDAAGNMHDWWSAKDAEKFNAATKKLAAQFDSIVVVKKEHANGQLTLGENTADQGGLRIAYNAFKKTQEGQSNEEIGGFTPDQRFYLSYGRIWAENITDQAAYQQTKSDPHSLGRWRVNATLRNIDTFFKAFNIKEGDKMYRAPQDRVIIW